MLLKRVRKKTDFFSSEVPKKVKKENHSESEKPHSQRERMPLKRIFPLENMLVWSYFKGNGWWPGRIADRAELDGPLDTIYEPTRWICWYGDNKYTEVDVANIAAFHDFDRYFQSSRFDRNRSYRLAVMEALQEACSRLGNYFSNVDDAVAWAQSDFLPGGYRKLLPELKEDEKTMLNCFSPSKILVVKRKDVNDVLNNEKIKSEILKRRNKALLHVHSGKLDIEDICIRCGDQIIEMQHPFFHGGLCLTCKADYVTTVCCTNMQGEPVYCIFCAGDGEKLFCSRLDCSKCFCVDCIQGLIGPSSSQSEINKEHWICFLCRENPHHGLLVRRENWTENLHIYLSKSAIYSPLHKRFPVVKKKLRVLSLFDGISAGLLALKKLDIDIECYYASEIDRNAMNISKANHPEIIHVGDVRGIGNKQLLEWGPFDLLIGGSPCNDLAIVNPKRKGLWSDSGTGWLFFEYFRVMNACSIIAASIQRPFFWLFENVLRMDQKSKDSISWYFQTNPVLLDAATVSAASRPRLFWGNLPGMLRPLLPCPDDKLTLQECLENGRLALVNKIGTITTNTETVSNKAMQKQFPVLDNLQKHKDVLWLTEIERAFGLPDHYTDKFNISCTGRRAALGRTWSVPVIRHLLAPLQQYYLP